MVKDLYQLILLNILESIDEHILWNKQVVQIKTRVTRAIDMSSKLGINPNFHILKTAYHSLFELHLQYGSVFQSLLIAGSFQSITVLAKAVIAMKVLQFL